MSGCRVVDDFRDYTDLEKVLEQCCWLSAEMEHGENRLYFNTSTGLIHQGKVTMTKETDDIIFVVGHSEEAFKQYVGLINVSLEKAFVANKTAGSFECHHLMRLRYSDTGRKVYKNILNTHPELFV